MSSIRSFRGLALMAAFAFSCAAQNGVITLYSPAARLLVGGQVPLSATITNIVGTPIDSSALTWSSSDSSVASVSGDGLASGLNPGDVVISVTDANTGATAGLAFHVVPAVFTVSASMPVIRAGGTSKLTATALDVVGNAIPGQAFQFRSGESAIARVSSDGTVTGVAEGFATVIALIPSATADAALVATTQIQVLPAAQYTVKKLLSTENTSATSIAAYSTVVAETSAEVASIVSLANGGQAAMLYEGARSRVLAVAGQKLPNVGRMVVRIDSISTNKSGDVAVLVEYPTQWCNAVVILFPRGGKPEQELGAANCGSGMKQHSLGEDGTVIARIFDTTDEIVRLKAGVDPQVLFSVPTQPSAKDPVRVFNDFAPSPAGTFMLYATLNSGTNVYLYSDGKSLTQVYQSGDAVNGRGTNSMDLPVGTADGSFYARVNGPNFEALQQLVPGTPRTLIVTQNAVASGGTLGWIHNIVDAGKAGVLVMGDLQTSDYHTSLMVWQGTGLTEVVRTAGYGAMISGAFTAEGSSIFSGALAGDSGPLALRTIADSTSAPTILQGANAPFAQPAPAGVDWHYAARGAAGNSIVMRGAGDSVIQVTGTQVQPVLTLGAALPNGKPCVWIGGVSANQAGDAVFTAGYATGSMLLRYRGGKLDTVSDTAVSKGPGGISVGYFFNYRGRFLAMNNRGDIANVAGYGNTGVQDVVLNASDGPHLVAQQGQPAPGGGTYSNFGNLALDENGRVLFVGNTTAGKTSVYYWDGNSAVRVIGVGDTNAATGLTVNEVSNVSGGGSGFLIVLAFNSYQTREVRYFDGQNSKTLISTDTSYFDGTGVSWFWMNECTLAGNGDAHCQAQTQDGGNGVYAHRTDGSDAIVARSRDQLPGGEWMIIPLVVNSTASGGVFFTADVLVNGVEQLALYQAVRVGN